MRLFIFILFSFVLPKPAQGQTCAHNENNVESHTRFTEADYLETVRFWKEQEPAWPGLVEAIRGYNLYKSEKVKVRKLRGDKAKHCYIGCRLAKEISFELAVYVAWYKEQIDLTDCQPGTTFEAEDFNATVEGAEKTEFVTGHRSCLFMCE